MKRLCGVALVGMVIAIGGCSDDGPSGGTITRPGRVIGRIELADGRGASSCLVSIPSASRAGRCDKDGNFDIDGVPAGDTRELQVILDPDSDRRRVIERVVRVGVNPGLITDRGTLRLLEPGSVGGRVKLSGQAPAFSIISVAQYGAVTAATAQGAYLLPRVPPGRHTLVLTTNEGAQITLQDVEVEPGRTTKNIDFNLADAKKVSLDVSGVAKREGKGDNGNGGLDVELLDLRDGKAVTSVKTEDNGNFSVNAPAGLYALRVTDGDNPIRPTVPYLLVQGDEAVALSYTIVVPSPDGDLDADGIPNKDDDDKDGDGVKDDDDAFPYDPAETKDTDKDGLGDRADLNSKGSSAIDDVTPTPDTDNDGYFDFEDNCKDIANGKNEDDQADRDLDGVGDKCDNCPGVPNRDQLDSVGDGKGDLCRICIVDTPCEPANPCHEGRLLCTANNAICDDTGAQLANGQPCGSGQVCNNGKCDICRAGETCRSMKAGEECKAGTLSCASGVGECTNLTGDAGDGTVCGVDKVCLMGVCTACKAGVTCDPNTNLCKKGTSTCTNGVLGCVPNQLDQPDGKSCGTDLVCRGGNCVQCKQGDSCQPKAKPCNAGTFDCTQNDCIDSQTPAADGTACGNGMFCQNGTCTTLPNTLSVVSGDNQSASAGALLSSITVEVKNSSNQPQVGETLEITAPPGGLVSPTSAITNAAGRVTFVPRLGPGTGQQTMKVRSPTAGTISITATATPPPAGKSVVLVNRLGGGGNSNGPEPAIEAKIFYPYGVVAASDGTIYFADNFTHRIRVLYTDGTLDVLAGTSTAGYSGDFGPAKNARLSRPDGLFLDEPNKLLYVADSGNHRVRVIDLSSSAHIINTVAGNGTVGTVEPYGDNGAATAAALSGPTRVAIGADGALYITDLGHTRIRRVDLQNNRITTWVNSTSSCQVSELSLSSCITTGCAIAFNSAGDMFLSGYFCGAGRPSTPGIVRVDSSGKLHWVAGAPAGVGSTGVGGDARDAYVLAPWIGFDSAGNLIYSSPTEHVVRRIDARTHRVGHIAGVYLSSGVAANFADAATSRLYNPRGFAIVGGDLVLADSSNNMMRRIPLVDITTPTAVQVTQDGGNNQSQTLGRLISGLRVKITAAGSSFAGGYVHYTSTEPSVVLSAADAKTAGDGVAVASTWVPLEAGSYSVSAEVRDIHGAHVSGSPQTFMLTAQAPSTGTIFPIINPTGVSNPLPAFAPLTALGAPTGVAAQADGTLYVGQQTTIIRITPKGIAQPFAGGGSGIGDGGPAMSASFTFVWRMYFDEAKKHLIVVDTNADRVRRIDTQTNIITTIAGGGTLVGVDNIPATQAKLDVGSAVTDASGGLWLTDGNNLRYVDPQTQLIRTVTGPTSCSNAIAFGGCASDACALQTDGSGGVYLTGAICGTDANVSSAATYGILRVSSTGALTHIAGRYQGATTDGGPATGYHFQQATLSLLRDGNNLYVGSDRRVYRVAIGGTITRVAGTGASGNTGDYGPATSATLYTPNDLALLPGGHVVMADNSSRALRVLW
ncbi:MAG: hypothetical protein KC503_20750 [Myxococcales bacterium]|nr:hypothetical protein [Myxococcales bacterium]